MNFHFNLSNPHIIHTSSDMSEQTPIRKTTGARTVPRVIVPAMPKRALTPVLVLSDDEGEVKAELERQQVALQARIQAIEQAAAEKRRKKAEAAEQLEKERKDRERKKKEKERLDARIAQQKRDREIGSGETSARKRKVSTAPESDDDEEEEEESAAALHTAHGRGTLACVKCMEAGRTCTWSYWASNIRWTRCDPCRDDPGRQGCQ